MFLILCIGADDLFVYMDTWRASATLPEAISGSLETRLSYTWRKAAGTMFATTLTTCVCLGLTAISTIPTVRAFGLFGSALVLSDYLMVITWFPAVVVWYEKHMCCKRPKPTGPAKPLRVARMMRDTFAPALYKVRFFALFVSIALGALGIAVRVRFFTPAAAIPLFKSSHPWERRTTLAFGEFFRSSSGDDDKVFAAITYGLAATPTTYETSFQLLPDREEASNNRRGCNPYTLGVRTVQYDPTFLSDASQFVAAQERIVDNCEAALADAALVARDDSHPNGEGYCLLKEVKAYAGAAFPFPDGAALQAGIGAYYAHLTNASRPGYTWDSTMGFVDTNANSRRSNARTGILVDPDTGKITAVYDSFATSLSRRELDTGIFGGDPKIVAPAYIPWQRFVEARCAEGSVTAGCIQTIYTVPGAVKFMDLLGSLSSFANQTIFICVIGCFFILVLVTMNVIVALYATLTVALVIAGVMGCIIAAGMEDGMYENIFTILVVGMSIDYAVHLSHFYNHATGTRYEKAQSAMHGVGVSVIGSAITTIGAGVPLFFCVVMFFFVQVRKRCELKNPYMRSGRDANLHFAYLSQETSCLPQSACTCVCQHAHIYLRAPLRLRVCTGRVHFLHRAVLALLLILLSDAVADGCGSRGRYW